MYIPERTSKSLAGLEALCQHVVSNVKHRPLSMVEVGGWTGAGTSIFANYFEKISVVDPWDPAEGEIAAESDVHGAEKLFDQRNRLWLHVEKIKARSPEAAARFLDKSLDMVYIDGLHSYPGVKADIDGWLPKIKSGGFLCGHDYETRFPGVIQAVNEKFNTLKRFPDTSWAVRI